MGHNDDTMRQQSPLKPSAARQALDIFQYIYPVILLFFFIIAFVLQSIISSRRKRAPEPESLTGPDGRPLPYKRKTRADEITLFTRNQKLTFQWLSVALVTSFAANCANVILHVLVAKNEGGWWCGKAAVVYIIGSFFVYSLFTISMFDQTKAPTAVHLSTWLCAFTLELVIAALYFSIHTTYSAMDVWEAIDGAIFIARMVLLLLAIGLFWVFESARRRASIAPGTPDEQTSLLNGNSQDTVRANGNGHGHGHAYGATNSAKGGSQEGEPGWVRPEKVPRRSWWEYISSYKVFFPYLWPSKDRKLQLLFVACFTIVIIQRGTNLLVPLQVGVLIDDLSGAKGEVKMPWGDILLYFLFRVLNGGNGMLSQLRSWLWIPINQYSYRELSTNSFQHVHGLSLDFHLGKKTGEVMSALGKGNSINNFLEQLTFQFIPMIVDLGVGIVYFLVKFDAYLALVVSIVTFWYIYLTVRIAQWRIDVRREMNNADRAQDGIKNDSLQGYESVKYFGAEAYEFDRYRQAVIRFQSAEYRSLYTLNFMNVAQNLLFTSGVLVCCFIAAYQVTYYDMGVGDFVAMITYLTQLQQPLNFFGTFYRSVQNSMISSERMLELFREAPTVVDSEDAEELRECEGEIKFSNVYFAYDNRKQALKGLDFTCRPGTTTALVGESGGGKSTVFRLLFRFYKVSGGSIEVDGHDLEDVTIDSVRKFIGVVPQDTALFNESLMYNLKYANQDASDEDVYDACRAASIHDKIMSFPDGYDTKVGERGLRLSGGEKQRVAIARTILKGPPIILLDEATAALDTETEQHIQQALANLGRGRTMLVIAHRLSTITQADQILVLHEGRVLERGSHTDLIAQKGKYYNMWRKQAEAQKAADKARALNDKAEELRRQSKDMTAAVNTGPEDFSSSGSTPHVSDGEDESKRIASATATAVGGEDRKAKKLAAQMPGPEGDDLGQTQQHGSGGAHS